MRARGHDFEECWGHSHGTQRSPVQVSLWLLQLAVRNKNIMKVTAHGIIFARSPIVGPTTAYREKNPRLPKKE